MALVVEEADGAAQDGNGYRDERGRDRERMLWDLGLEEGLVRRPVGEGVDAEAAQPAGGDREERQDHQRDRDGLGRLVGVAMAPELAEEREPDAPAHVGRG